MKRKTFYLLVMICCLSVFSSAKQANYCCKKISCLLQGSAVKQATKPVQKNGMSSDVSPLQLIVFNL
ncbi:MAG TPA: hypothetical protein VHD35_13855 [Chitinophagaceae bacterium]|nr:hypothetical protein [Chitinophagaceae bacterium]